MESQDDVEFAKVTIAAKVQTRAEPDQGEQPEVQERVFMVRVATPFDYPHTQSNSLHLGFTAISLSGSLSPTFQQRTLTVLSTRLSPHSWTSLEIFLSSTSTGVSLGKVSCLIILYILGAEQFPQSGLYPTNWCIRQSLPYSECQIPMLSTETPLPLPSTLSFLSQQQKSSARLVRV